MADLLREHRTLILAVLTGVVGLVLVIVFARWFSRTRGWRRTIARRRRQFAGGIRDLGRLAGAWYRFHRDVRAIAALLGDPTLGPHTVAALTAAGEAAGGDTTRSTPPGRRRPAAWPFQAVVRTDTVQVRVAGREVENSGPILARAELAAPPARAHCPVAVGLLPGQQAALALLDLAVLPSVGTIEGPPDLSRRLAATIAAQLAAGLVAPVRTELIVVDAILPGFGGPPLSAALDLLEQQVAAAAVAAVAADLTVLVCPAPAGGDLPRLVRLVGLLPGLRVLMVGRYPGPRWRLELDALGRITAPELGLHADCAPLERGVARALRHLDRKRRRAPQTPQTLRASEDGWSAARPDGAHADPDPSATTTARDSLRPGGATHSGDPQPPVGGPPVTRPEPPDTGGLTEPEPSRRDASHAAAATASHAAAAAATARHTAVEAGAGVAGVED